MRIELRGVRKRYHHAEVLKGIDLVIPSGRRVALVGPNGSGKSTLLRAVLGLVECRGEVLLDGRAPFVARREIAQRLAYVPQVAPQLSATVAEVVALVTLTRALGASAVDAAARLLDFDLAAIGPQPFRALSGGLKQKVLIAVALAARPSLLLLDEPTASLDARARERLLSLCTPATGVLPPGLTLVVCSHRLEEFRGVVDHVVALDDGRVTFDGPARNFVAASEFGPTSAPTSVLPGQARDEGTRSPRACRGAECPERSPGPTWHLARSRGPGHG